MRSTSTQIAASYICIGLLAFPNNHRSLDRIAAARDVTRSHAMTQAHVNHTSTESRPTESDRERQRDSVSPVLRVSKASVGANSFSFATAVEQIQFYVLRFAPCVAFRTVL